jgi:hypothetical protein
VAGRLGLVARVCVLALALMAGAGAIAPAIVGPVVSAQDGTPITGDQQVPNVGRTPESATLVAGGATVRSIFDPNRGVDRWFAIDLAEGESLAVAVDAAAPGTVALTGSPVDAGSIFVGVDPTPPGTTVQTAGRYLVRYQGPAGSGASPYALTFVVTPSPRATLPPDGMLVCGAVDLSGRIAQGAPGTLVCPGAIVTSEVSGAHPDDVYAIDLAWSESLAVTTDGAGVAWTFAYPSDVTSSTGPVWYPLAQPQVASESGTFLVRASLADGATAAPYTATFGVTPVDASTYALVQDIELAPGCVIRSAGAPLTALPVGEGQTVLLRVVSTDPSPQDLVIGPADALAAGRVDGLATAVTQPDLVTAVVWQAAMGATPWAIGCVDTSLAVRSIVPVSTAPALVTVPDVAGMTLSKAAGALGAVGLTGGAPRSVPDAAPAGTVIGTDPAAGTQVPVDAAVTLILSSGPPAASTGPTPVPQRTLPPAPTLEPTGAPARTPRPTPGVRVTPPPVSSTASPKAPEPVAFSCDGRTVIADPLERGWTVTRVFWARRATYDRVTVRLERDPRRDGGRSRVILETLTPDEVAAVLPGVPVEGDAAVTLRFAGPIRVTGDMTGSPDMGSLRSVVITRGDDNRPWAVVGADGDGCAALTVTAWTDPSTQTTPFVDVTLDIEH